MDEELVLLKKSSALWEEWVINNTCADRIRRKSSRLPDQKNEENPSWPLNMIRGC